VTPLQGPYALPTKLAPGLSRVLSYWRGLERREAQMPFWDDVKLSALPELADRLFLLEVFDRPLRFRFGFGLVGEAIKREYGGDVAGKFLDEIGAGHPLQFLLSQASATVESRRPTYYRHRRSAPRAVRAEAGYSRLALPMWGDGRVGMLLGACAWG
jgi:hypothetical protein